MKALFTFLLICVHATADDGGVKHVQVRVVSFDKAGAATALAAVAPDGDEALYASLTADAAAGTAARVQDQTVVVRGGQRSKTEAVQEFPYVTGSEVRPEEWFSYPSTLQWKNLGFTMQAEATVGEPVEDWPQCPLDLNLAPECGALVAMHPWPAPDLRTSGKTGRVLQPVFAIHRVNLQLLTWTGRTMLIAVSPSPDAAFSAAAEPVFRYTFFRAGLNGEKPRAGAPPEVVRQRRLHILTIRLPRDEAAALLLQHAGDDAALYAELCGRMAAGKAALSGHTALHCRAGQQSSMGSRAEWFCPKSYADLTPDRWEQRSAGVTLEVEADGSWEPVKRDAEKPAAGKDEDAPGTGWNIALQQTEAPELVSYYPSAKHPELHGAVAEQVRRKLLMRGSLPPSGVLCAGVVSTSPATEEDGEEFTDVCLLMQSPAPAASAAAEKPQIFLQGAILSVLAAEGPALAAAMQAPETLAGLLERLAAGDKDITCAAHAGIVIRHGERCRTECVRGVTRPGKFATVAIADDEKVKLPGKWAETDCGLILEAECKVEKEDVSLNLFLGWDTAPVAGLGKPGEAVPEMAKRRSEEKVELKDFKLRRGQPVIVDVRASNAREGTPEHGRWHVTVLLGN